MSKQEGKREGHKGREISKGRQKRGEEENYQKEDRKGGRKRIIKRKTEEEGEGREGRGTIFFFCFRSW